MAAFQPLGYENEPKPKWWSPWRRWLRRWLLLLVPLLLGLIALGVALTTAATLLAGSASAAFAGAIVGAIVATFGNLLIQYLLALTQEWRWERERHYKEIAIATTLSTELGEAAVRMNLNRQLLQTGNPQAIAKVVEVLTPMWEALRVQAAEFWSPKTILELSATYTAVRLVNAEIREESARLGEADFHEAMGQLVLEMKREVKKFERRLYRIGRE